LKLDNRKDQIDASSDKRLNGAHRWRWYQRLHSPLQRRSTCSFRTAISIRLKVSTHTRLTARCRRWGCLS